MDFFLAGLSVFVIAYLDNSISGVLKNIMVFLGIFFEGKIWGRGAEGRITVTGLSVGWMAGAQGSIGG